MSLIIFCLRTEALYILGTFTGVGAITAQKTLDRSVTQTLQHVVPTSLVPGLTSITSVAWDHESPQLRFATGSRDGTIFIWTPSFQPQGTAPARKAPIIKWQSPPFPAPPPIEILSSPTERSGGMGNADIEFEAIQLSQWEPEELEIEVVSVASDHDSPSRDRVIFDSPESPVRDSLVTISTGQGGGPLPNLS